MTNPQPSEVWRCGALDGTQKLVLLAILDYGRLAYPRQAVLAAKCGISKSTCQRTVDGLRASGVLTTTTKGKALSYRVNLTGQQIPQSDVSRNVNLTSEKRQFDVSSEVNLTSGSYLAKLTSPPNQQTATAVSGSSRETREPTSRASVRSAVVSWSRTVSATVTHWAHGACCWSIGPVAATMRTRH